MAISAPAVPGAGEAVRQAGRKGVDVIGLSLPSVYLRPNRPPARVRDCRQFAGMKERYSFASSSARLPINPSTAPQMAENVPASVFRRKLASLLSGFRGVETVGVLCNRRFNASVSEHFTLNKSRISSAKRPTQFYDARELGLATYRGFPEGPGQVTGLPAAEQRSTS
jgi:hypothetical protein